MESAWPPLETAMPRLAVGEQLRVADSDRGAERGGEAVRHPDRFLRVVEVAHDDHELVASVARHEVALAHRRDHAFSGRAQQRVADGVPERVVDVLEVVEVDEQDRGAEPRAPARGQGPVELVEDERPVGEPGERVVARGVLERGLGGDGGGGVPHGRDDRSLGSAVDVEQRAGAGVDPHPRAVAASDPGAVGVGNTSLHLDACPLEHGDLVGVHQLLQLLADQVVGRPSEHAGHRRADPLDDGLAREQHHVAGVLGEEPEALLARRQRLGGAEVLESHLHVAGQVDQQLERGGFEGLRRAGRHRQAGPHPVAELERDGDRRTDREVAGAGLPRIERGGPEVVDVDLHRAGSQASSRGSGVGRTVRPVRLQRVDLVARTGPGLDADGVIVVVVDRSDPDHLVVGIGDEGVTDVLEEADVVGRPDEDAHRPTDRAEPVHLGVRLGGAVRGREGVALVRAGNAARGRRHVRRCRLRIHPRIVGL